MDQSADQALSSYSRPLGRHALGLFAILVAAIVIFLTSWLAQDKIKEYVGRGVAENLEAILNISYRALFIWVKEEKATAQIWAADMGVVKLAGQLLTTPQSAATLISSPAQAELRNRLQPVLEARRFQGFFIISPTGVNLASTRDTNIGAPSLLLEQHEFWSKVLGGEAVISLPQESDVPLIDEHGELVFKHSTLFVAAPIRDARGEVSAVLAFRIDPHEDFTAILQRGSIGASGETYAFNAQGKMISSSRFDLRLIELGLVPEGMDSILNIDLRDPGVNLLEGEMATEPLDERPFTLMIENALSNGAGKNVDGYRDYRGVEVVGAWLWDEELRFGIATEMKYLEAYRHYYLVSMVIKIFTALSTVTVLLLSFSFVYGREKVLKSEQRLLDFSHTAADWFWEMDENLRFSFFSDRFYELSGFTRNELIGKSRTEIVNPADLEGFSDKWEKHFKTLERHQPFKDFEYRLFSARGARIHIQISGKPTFGDDGAFKGYRGAGRDITKWRQAIRDLQESEERYRTVIDNLLEGILIVDEEGIIQSFSPSAERIFGYQADEVIYQHVNMLIPKSYHASHIKLFNTFKETGAPQVICLNREVVGVRKDSQIFPMELSVSTMNLGEGHMYATVVRDISQRKEAELEVRKLSHAVEQSPVIAIIADPKGLIEYVNPKFTEITGYTQEDVIGKNPNILQSGDTSKKLYDEMWQTILGGGEWHGEIQNRKKNGDFFWVLVSIAAVKDRVGKILNFVCIQEDITEQKRNMEELRQAQQLTEQALSQEKEYSKRQSEFVSMVSHEFRTPLTIIDSSAQRMFRRKDKMSADELMERTETIRNAVQRMVGLIEATLYSARLDAGKIKVERQPLNLKAQIIDVCARQAEVSPSHTIKNDLDGLPETIYADAKIMDQIFTNLMSNAVKYSHDNPQIEVRGWTETGSGGEAQAVISVTDQGVGIPEDEIPNMFERFFRASTSKGIPGTGIGLNVVHDLITMYGGTIKAESAEGKGSTFTVYLPVGEPNAADG